MTEIKIPFSKKKKLLMLLGAAIFVLLGVLFVTSPGNFTSPFHQNMVLIRLVGLSSGVFFGGCAIYGTIKPFDNKYGLIINNEGIIDNTNASSIGLINWADILSIKIENVISTRFLLIFIKNPENYINRAKGLKRKLLYTNMKMYGTPISIISNSIKFNFDDLEDLIKTNLNEYQKNNFT